MFQKLKKQKRYDWQEEQQMKSSKKKENNKCSLRKQREKMDRFFTES